MLQTQILKINLYSFIHLRTLDHHIQISFNTREIIPQTPAWAYKYESI